MTKKFKIQTCGNCGKTFRTYNGLGSHWAWAKKNPDVCVRKGDDARQEEVRTHSIGDDCPGGHIDIDTYEILSLLLESIAADDDLIPDRDDYGF